MIRGCSTDEWGSLLVDLENSCTSPTRKSIPKLPFCREGLGTPDDACDSGKSRHQPALYEKPEALASKKGDGNVPCTVRPPRPPSVDDADSDFWAMFSSTRKPNNLPYPASGTSMRAVATPSTCGGVRSAQRPPRPSSVDEESEFPPDWVPGDSENQDILHLHSAIRWNREKEVRRLLHSPHNTSCIAQAPDRINGNTALHVAAQNGHLKIVEVLLELKVSPDVKNNMENTPMHMSVTYNHDEVTRLLLHAGADRSKLNAKGHAADSGIDGEKHPTFLTWTIEDGDLAAPAFSHQRSRTSDLSPVPAA